LGIIGSIVKNNRWRFWEAPERIIGEFLSIIGAALNKKLQLKSDNDDVHVPLSYSCMYILYDPFI